MSIDLNKLRDNMVKNQEDGKSYPVALEDKVFVDKEGKIIAGDSVNSEQARQLSEVPQETFAELDNSDLLYANKNMPANTRVHTTGQDVRGLLYSVTCEFGNEYTLFAYKDGAAYYVILVDPELEYEINGHSGHLYTDGKICLSRGRVYSLKDAYTKSVIWASGMSVARAGGEFPFAYDQ